MGMGGCWGGVGWIGGGLQEHWRSLGGGWTPEVWPGYAPVWGLCADLLEKSHFFVKIRFFVNFSFRALKLLANREEQLLTFFGFLPPYFDVSRSLA